MSQVVQWFRHGEDLLSNIINFAIIQNKQKNTWTNYTYFFKKKSIITFEINN